MKDGSSDTVLSVKWRDVFLIQILGWFYPFYLIYLRIIFLFGKNQNKYLTLKQ